MNMGSNLGGLVSPALTPVLAAAIGWENALHVAAALSVVGGLLWLGVGSRAASRARLRFSSHSSFSAGKSAYRPVHEDRAELLAHRSRVRRSSSQRRPGRDRPRRHGPRGRARRRLLPRRERDVARETEIPADRPRGARRRVEELTSKRTRELIEAAASRGSGRPEERKVGDYYATFMDEAAIEAKGLAPLKADLDAVAAIEDGTLARMLGRTLRADVDALNATNFDTENLFGLWVAQDLDDPSKYSPFLLQGGLGMPDRDYYLDAPRMADIRAKYRAHIATMLTLAGVPDADAKAARIFELEQKIAEAHATARTPRTSRRATTTGRARTSRRRRRDSTGRRSSRPRPRRQSAFVVWQPGASPGSPRSSPGSRSTRGRIPRLRPRRAPRRSCRGVRRRAVRVLRQDAHGRAEAARALEARRRRHERRARRGRRKLYVARYFPAAEKARAEAMVKNGSRRSGSGSTG